MEHTRARAHTHTQTNNHTHTHLCPSPSQEELAPIAAFGLEPEQKANLKPQKRPPQYYVFSSAFANEAALAVLRGEAKSIIEYHKMHQEKVMNKGKPVIKLPVKVCVCVGEKVDVLCVRDRNKRLSIGWHAQVRGFIGAPRRASLVEVDVGCSHPSGLLIV